MITISSINQEGRTVTCFCQKSLVDNRLVILKQNGCEVTEIKDSTPDEINFLENMVLKPECPNKLMYGNARKHIYFYS